MRVHVVSDVHGSADALARAGDGADALVCLGDLLLFVDYADHRAGVPAGGRRQTRRSPVPGRVMPGAAGFEPVRR